MFHNNTTHSPCNYQHWRTRQSKWIGRLPHSSFISQVVQCSLMTVDWRSRNGFKWSHRTWNIHNVHLDMWKFSFHSSAGTTFETKLLHQEHVLPGLVQYHHAALLQWQQFWCLLKTNSFEVIRYWLTIRFTSLEYASSVANIRKIYFIHSEESIDSSTSTNTANTFMMAHGTVNVLVRRLLLSFWCRISHE